MAYSYRLSEGLWSIISCNTTHLIDWSEMWRLQWEQRELKAPQERSDEEIEAVPTESVHM